MLERIVSRNNNLIKSVAELRESGARRREGLFCFEGVHLLEEAKRFGAELVYVFVREGSPGGYFALAAGSSARVFEVTDAVYDRLTEEKAPQGVFAVARMPKNIRPLSESIPGGCAAVLCDIQDSGNVGTVIRTAAAFGTSVVLAGACADIFSKKTVRATMGAVFSAEIYTCPSGTEAARILKAAGRRTLACALRGDAYELGGFAMRSGDSFFIGNEGKGLSAEVINGCDIAVRIPMTNLAESLNAAAAAAVMLWEARRAGI